MGTKRADVIIGVILIMFAAWIYWYTARTLPTEAQMYTLGPDVFPKLLALLLAFLSLTLIVTALIKGRAQGIPDTGGRIRAMSLLSSSIFRAVVAMVIYIAIMPSVGYIPSTVLFLAFLIWAFGGKKAAQMLIPAAIVTASLYLLFGVVLNVLLPPGVFLR